MMLNKLNFEDRIKQELTAKAKDVEVPDLMFSRIANRIKNNSEVNRSMLKDKYHSVFMRKGVGVSLAAILVIVAVMFTLSSDVRAATLSIIDSIKTIFVLDKSHGGYKIVEKTTDDTIFSPTICRTTTQSDEELTNKMGFNLTFPKILYGGYMLEDKSVGVGINRKVTMEMVEQLQSDILKAIDDEAIFNSLSQYNPYRNVGGTYIKEGNMIFIEISPADSSPSVQSEDISKAIDTSVGDVKAGWFEVVTANYKHIAVNGIGAADYYTKPNGTSKNHILTWKYNGVRYVLGTLYQFELAMDEAVRIAEAFMEVQ